jgi:hypothetical protein
VPSRERARHAMLLLKSMLVRGLLGADPETVAAVADLDQFVEGETMPTELPEPMGYQVAAEWRDKYQAEREKVAALEESLRDAHRGKPAFELLAADLARASGLPASATWQEHIAACVALRAQVEADQIRIVPVPEGDAA